MFRSVMVGAFCTAKVMVNKLATTPLAGSSIRNHGQNWRDQCFCGVLLTSDLTVSIFVPSLFRIWLGLEGGVHLAPISVD